MLLLPLASAYLWLALIAAVCVIVFFFKRLWVFTFLSGMLYTLIYVCLVLHAAVPESLLNKPIIIEAKIQQVMSMSKLVRRLRVNTQRINTEKHNANLQLNLYNSSLKCHTGQVWRFRVKLHRPRGLKNFSGMRYDRYALTQHLQAIGYIQNSPQNILLHDVRKPLSTKLAEAITQLPVSARNQALLSSLLLGARTGLTVQDWQVLQQTGTSHLLAISGLHIGLIMLFGYTLARLLLRFFPVLFRYYPLQPMAGLFGLACGFFYVSLTGFGVSALRSFFMLALSLFFACFDRQLGLGKRLGLAFCILLILNPLALWSLSLWLSALAVAFIAYVLQVTQSALPRWRLLLKRWLYLQFAFLCGSAGIGLLAFQTWSLVAPVANFIAVPVVSWLVLPLALIAAVFLLLGLLSPAQVCLKLAAMILTPLWSFLATLSQWPLASWHFALQTHWLLILPMLFVVVLLLPRGWQGRYLVLFFVLPLVFTKPASIKPGQFILTVLDVGQGLATVIQTEHHVMVYDTGPKSPAGFDAGRAVVVPYLRTHAYTSIDKLMVSHGDNDHIGGAAYLLAQLPVADVLSSIPSKLPVRYVRPCGFGQTWHWDGVAFQVLGPVLGEPYRDNNSSCVLKISTHHASALLVGDIEAAAERELIQRVGQQLHADIIVAPHHGSRTSSIAEFVRTVHPSLVVYATGAHNRYRFPANSVKLRYSKMGAKSLNTAKVGAIEISTT